MACISNFGWFGLGSMGLAMALNLQRYLAAQNMPVLRYSNRTLSRGEALKDAGATAMEDFESVVEKSDVLFTMISNDEVLRDLVSRVVKKGISMEGKTWVDMSTVHPQTCTECAARLSERGATFIASPVFGASPVAAAGKLIFAMAGPEKVIERLRPFIMDVMGRRIIYMGPDVQKSSLLKISGNIFVIGFQELIAEGLVYAEKTGLGTRQMEEFIGDMFGPAVQSYSKRMTSGAFAPPLDTAPGFALSLAVKDATHAVSVGKQHGTDIPTLETALSRMKSAHEFAGDSLDSSALYGIARMNAGLSFWSENSRNGN